MILGQRASLKLLTVFVGIFACFLVGCGNNSSKYQSEINLPGFELIYNGNVKLESVPLKTDDLEEVTGLYQEVGDGVGYRDSLLIAEKYSRGMGINAFAQDNLDVLGVQGLTLSDINKTQIGLKKHGENINAVLVEYKITEGLVKEIPILYVSQLFIPDGSNVILLSFITENQQSSNAASNMFKNIK